MVVELVGPAGAGKSTLAQNVHRADSGVHVGLSLWGLPRTRLVEGAIALVPTIVVAAVRRRLRWREIAQMIRLDALRRVLRRAKARHPVILLDEGPVFGISWLDLAFAQRGVKAPEKWRRRSLAQWARLLDSVIFLDAQDRTLAGRIRTRSKRHRMAKGSDVAIRRFANGFRSAFDKVIAELGGSGRLVVDQVRTDGRLEHSTERLRATLARQCNGH
ncbi:MAG: ATP-binding protein [Gemmatimonadales bacterium]